MNCMFKDRNDWVWVTDEQKEKFFFIANRYFSKKYPDLAQLLNHKNIDKVSGMNIWFHFMDGKPYPSWFWSKSEKKLPHSDLSEKDLELLLEKTGLHPNELDILIKHHLQDVKEELKYFKELQKTK